jgi:hypothetical protein
LLQSRRNPKYTTTEFQMLLIRNWTFFWGARFSIDKAQLRHSRIPTRPHTCHAPPIATLPCIGTFRRQATSGGRTRDRKSKPRQPSPSPRRYPARLNARGPLLTDGTQRIFSGAPHSGLSPENFCYSVGEQGPIGWLCSWSGDASVVVRATFPTPLPPPKKFFYGALEAETDRSGGIH